MKHGRIALVTGASRGIGAGIATALAREGMAVAITSRRLDDLGETVQRIEHAGARAVPVELEVTSAASIRAAVERVRSDLGPIDLLVNNAGVNVPRPAVDVTEDQWDQVLDTNLKGPFLCAQIVGQEMIALGKGKIVNISSAAGLIPAGERVAYCSSKAGLIMLTRVLALEWAKHGITVNAVAPTFVETELAAQTLNRPGMRDYWTQRIPLGRLASVDDVAAAVLYLASPAADFVTGTVLTVDGGLTMR
ncbi:MAG: hypothetical protein QOF73_1164 [Thermomicrobiales bacterium]|nr:hypothetical protein [Thermomicrobiales bacterium]